MSVVFCYHKSSSYGTWSCSTYIPVYVYILYSIPGIPGIPYSVSKSWYRQAKDMYRYCSSECVLVLSVPCILTVLGIAIVIEHVSRKRYNCPPAKSSRCKIWGAESQRDLFAQKVREKIHRDAKSRASKVRKKKNKQTNCNSIQYIN